MTAQYGWWVIVCALVLLLSGCVHPDPLSIIKAETSHAHSQTALKDSILIQVEQRSLSSAESNCQDRFIPHPLDHITTIEGDVVRLYESNGAGLAINDLDRDGDLDLVLANLAGPNAIFWNEGNFSFQKQMFPHGQSRAVSIVDIDGDGWQDIVFAHRETRPIVWLNDGVGLDQRGTQSNATEIQSAHGYRFTQQTWFSVSQRAYTMAWADLDGDVDLDLVVATYQTEYRRKDNTDLSGGGVLYYENQGDNFAPTHLATYSQALALMLIDLNNDAHLDIWVGHDFLMPDQVWFWSEGGWQRAEPFAVTPQNTMSFAAGDLNNDGQLELFAADMKPYVHSPQIQEAWAPLMASMEDVAADRQIVENVLQVPASDGSFENLAEHYGVTATGWSWSAKFGDLDQDGFLDFYVVNGMVAEELFGHLPNNELVEANLAFRNDGQGHLYSIPEWGLDSIAGGRSMSMADFDGDGDLDIAVNNLLSPSIIYENRLCGGQALTVDLSWPDSKNTVAIGARLILHTTTGQYMREVRSNSGYLSGDPSRIHFGFPVDSYPVSLDILWPDGQRSTLAAPPADTHLIIERLN